MEKNISKTENAETLSNLMSNATMSDATREFFVLWAKVQDIQSDFANLVEQDSNDSSEIEDKFNNACQSLVGQISDAMFEHIGKTINQNKKQF
jgi:hypothetical protein